MSKDKITSKRWVIGFLVFLAISSLLYLYINIWRGDTPQQSNNTKLFEKLNGENIFLEIPLTQGLSTSVNKHYKNHHLENNPSENQIDTKEFLSKDDNTPPPVLGESTTESNPNDSATNNPDSPNLNTKPQDYYDTTNPEDYKPPPNPPPQGR
jgi:hypothetical protein